MPTAEHADDEVDRESKAIAAKRAADTIETPVPEKIAEAVDLVSMVETAPQEQRLKIEKLVIGQISVRRLARVLLNKLKDSDTRSLQAMKELEKALEADGHSAVTPR